MALAGCSNSGSATAPAPTTTTSAVLAPSSGVQTTAPAAASESAFATSQPGATSSAPAPRSSTTSGANTAQPGATQLPPPPSVPLDTKLFPPPEVPRAAAGTPKKTAYLQALEKGGLRVTASGATELTIGQSVCDELARGSDVATMKKLLVPAGALAASLGQSALSGEQVANLYLDSAKANLC